MDYYFHYLHVKFAFQSEMKPQFKGSIGAPFDKDMGDL